MRYTLVRHSGYEVTGHYEFEFAVETAALTPVEVKKVLRAGGLVFEDYVSASEAEMEENYPPEVQGLVPRVRGTFSGLVSIGGLPLYLPAKVSEEV